MRSCQFLYPRRGEKVDSLPESLWLSAIVPHEKGCHAVGIKKYLGTAGFDLRLTINPHAAFYSLDSDEELRRRSVTNVTTFLETGRPENVVVEGSR